MRAGGSQSFYVNEKVSIVFGVVLMRKAEVAIFCLVGDPCSRENINCCTRDTLQIFGVKNKNFNFSRSHS